MIELGWWVALLVVIGLACLIYLLVEVIADSLDMPYEEIVKISGRRAALP